MKNLYAVASECMYELETLGIKFGKIVNFEVNYRAKSRWGQCCKKRDGYYINISNRLLQDDVEDKALKDTIIHEILHTCEGCMNHGTTWKKHADKVNKAYGYNIKRCTSAKEKGFDMEDLKAEKERNAKHKFVCEKCGQTILRQRESNFTKNYENYTCGRCGGKFEKLY